MAEGAAQGATQGVAQGVAQCVVQGVAQGAAQGVVQGVAQGVGSRRCPMLMPLGALCACPSVPYAHAPQCPMLMPLGALCSCPSVPYAHCVIACAYGHLNRLLVLLLPPLPSRVTCAFATVGEVGPWAFGHERDHAFPHSHCIHEHTLAHWSPGITTLRIRQIEVQILALPFCVL